MKKHHASRHRKLTVQRAQSEHARRVRLDREAEVNRLENERLERKRAFRSYASGRPDALMHHALYGAALTGAAMRLVLAMKEDRS